MPPLEQEEKDQANVLSDTEQNKEEINSDDQFQKALDDVLNAGGLEEDNQI